MLEYCLKVILQQLNILTFCALDKPKQDLPHFISVWICHFCSSSKQPKQWLGSTAVKCLLHVRGVAGSNIWGAKSNEFCPEKST